MSEHGWDGYIATIDDARAAIALDLDAADAADATERPTLLLIQIALAKPNPDGLADDSEAEALYAIEDSLESTVVSELDGRYVGHCTRSGGRSFFFYLPKTEGELAQLEHELERFEGYRANYTLQDDPDWKHYRKFLYPPPVGLHRLRTQRRLRALVEDLDVERELAHTMRFADPSSRAKIRAAAAGDGFTIQTEDDIDDATHPHRLVVTRPSPLDAEAIDDVALKLLAAARTLGGTYDGWDVV